MKTNTFLFFIFLSFLSQAQFLTPNRTYTKADSLRGTLNSYRSCYDVTYYDLTIKVDIENKFISGNNKIYYTAVDDFSVMQIDLFDNLQIEKITYGEQTCTFKREFNAVFITLPEKQLKGNKNSIQIFYSGNPQIAKNPPWDGGFSFNKDDQGRDWIGVSCEGLGASVWYPNKDHLSDEPDSMMIRTICREDLLCVANGNLIKKYPAENGYRQFDWFVSYPINNYNVSINIGNYVNFNQQYTSVIDGEKLALDYYVLDYNLDKAKKHFTQVIPMMECYEKYLGKYPFYKDGFALVETSYLGMEHQSGIAYGNKFLTGYLGYDYSEIGMNWDYIVIHESGHEWWGNNVSVKDIADLWVHEGICTYSEAIYVECLFGYDKAIEYTNARKNDVGNNRPVIGDYDVNNEGDDIYNKGFLLMHTLRHVVNNDSLWWEIIRGIQKDFAYKTVTSKEIENYISNKSGKDLTKIFDQYLRYATPPVLEYWLKQKGRKLEVWYRWQTDVNDFAMPIKYRTAKGEWEWITPTNEWQELSLKKYRKKDFKFDDVHFYYLSALTGD
ncbi:MAG: M1 family metallopeptidase [Fimbriimonadaceae bacterium]|nr:M1 family metallopeptidase [Chitinophagales bacterium]